MALVKCVECKKKVSTDAEKCPNCGIDNPAIKRENCIACKKQILSNADKCKHCGVDEPFQQKTKCKNCKKQVSIKAKTCPHCGVKDPSSSTVIGIIVFAVIFLGIIGFIFFGGETEQEAEVTEQARQAKQVERARAESEKQRKGFHCLSPLDGSHRGFKTAVKDRLNDPGSFDHDATYVSAVDSSGRHRITMKFRANNAFGAMILSEAEGWYSNKNCDRLQVDSIK